MVISKQYQKVVPFIMFVLIILLLFKLVQPMITVLLSSILLTYISFPLYKKIVKRIPHKSISIILTLLIIVIIILVPFIFLAFEVTQQGYYFSNSLSNNIEKGALFGFGCTSAESKVCSFLNQAERFSIEKLSQFGLDQKLQNLLFVFKEKMTNIFLSIPLMIAHIFLTLIISYFILKDRKNILKKIIEFLPLRKKNINRLIKEFTNITHTIIYAQLFVALVQGIIGTIGFYIFGVPFPIFFGVLLALCALIPMIGTGIIWVPASLFLVLSGYFSHNHWILWKGIGLFLYSLLITSTIDNLLLIKIVHTKTQVSQIVVIVGVIGGAVMFGIVGIFIGPILLPLLITYLKTFKERFA